MNKIYRDHLLLFFWNPQVNDICLFLFVAPLAECTLLNAVLSDARLFSSLQPNETFMWYDFSLDNLEKFVSESDIVTFMNTLSPGTVKHKEQNLDKHFTTRKANDDIITYQIMKRLSLTYVRKHRGSLFFSICPDTHNSWHIHFRTN